jgi:predicted permease
LSLPLLVGGGLLVRTLFNLQRVDLGYPRDGVLMVRVDAQAAGYDSQREKAAFEDLLARIRAIPGVRAATFSSHGLFSGSFSDSGIAVEGYTPTGRDDRESNFTRIAPGYFSTLGVPMVQGREITDRDRRGTVPVCVINETFAKRFFDRRNPLGLHVTTVDDNRNAREAFEIVGVVRDSRQTALRGAVEHRFYVSAAQGEGNIGAVTFLIRPHGDGSSVLAEARRILRGAQPNMPILRTATLTVVIDARIVEDRMLAQLSLAFGIVTMLLVAIGLYGVLSYGVARRTNEIGIRKALGAQPRTLVAMILRETGSLVLVGMIVGGGLSVLAIRLISARLYGLAPSDPATLSIAVTTLAAVALVATWLPAFRAARVDPLIALRSE